MSAAPVSESARVFGPEHDDFRESVRRYVRTELAPHREDWRHAGVPAGIFPGLAELGAVGLAVPEELGGSGVTDPRFRAVVTEELAGAGLVGPALMLVAHDDVGTALLCAAGRDAQVSRLATGAAVAAWAPLPATAVLEGNRLSGTARGVVNGGLADVAVVPARCADTIVLAVVDCRAEGVTRAPSPKLVGPAPLDRADLEFDAVAVHADDLLDAPLEAVEAVERLSVAICALAGARSALETTLGYVRERRAFGQLIASFENTKVAVADVHAEIEALRPFVHRCLAAHADGSLDPGHAAQAALRATAAYGRAADWGVQLHGGYGYMYDYEIAHAYTAARYLRLHGGGDHALRMTIASALLP